MMKSFWMGQLPRDPGIYGLLMHSSGGGALQIGKLGKLSIEPGFYLYLGSAHGPGGIKARVSRYLGSFRRLFWHIDYLQAVLSVQELWFSFVDSKFEHQTAECLSKLPDWRIPLIGFGSSDCNCLGHLFHHHGRVSVLEIWEDLFHSPCLDGSWYRWKASSH